MEDHWTSSRFDKTPDQENGPLEVTCICAARAPSLDSPPAIDGEGILTAANATLAGLAMRGAKLLNHLKVMSRGNTDALIGYVDQVTGRHARGWAADGSGEPLNLVASLNGTVVARFRASLFRPDLVDLPRKDLGFEVDLGRSVAIGDVVSVTNEPGDHLTGSPHRVTGFHATRDEKALWLVTREMKTLEIGPSYNPVAPRSKGWNSFSLDHATQEELRAKYRGTQAIERIEPVDYLWKGGPIETAIPVAEHGSFDVVLASHVIEHIPDPIGFFLSAAALLRDDGLISLVVPDKRTMFDFFKPVTLTSDYLQAHYVRRTRHTKKTAFDNLAFNVSEKGDIAWSPRPVGDFAFFGDDILPQAKQLFEQTIEDESGPYVDFHATVYTPSSFALIILDLGQLGILPFKVDLAFPTSGCEFFVTLRKGAPPKLDPAKARQERLRLMKATVRELAQQARWLIDENPESPFTVAAVP